MNRLSINLRISLACVLVLILAVAAIIPMSLSSINSIVNEAEKRELHGLFQNIKASIAAESRLGTAMSALVAGIPEVQQKFADDDRQGLAELFVPGFKIMKQVHGVRQFQFHTPPATSYLRVHKPEKHGDDLSSFRKTVIETNKKLKPVGGIEKGVAGLGVRGMVPVKHNGQHVGSVEFGMSFGQPFFENFKQVYGADVSLHLVSEQGIKTFASTFESKTLLDQQQIIQASQSGGLLHHGKLNENDVAVYANTVTDFSGKTVGVLEIIMNRDTYISAINQSMMSNILVALVAIALGLVISILVGRGIVKPIRRTVTAMKDIAEGDGDLTKRLDVSGNDEISQLAQAFNSFSEKVHALVSDVANASVQLTSSASEMSGITQDANVKMQSQRSEIDQVATAMNEMTATVQEVARNAADAAGSANDADNQAQQGLEVVKATIQAINSLASEVGQTATVINKVEADSLQIGAIVDVIRGIAEQTNLLALNAAIEAARAGEQGRGFAVVADEVRTLASRTQQSTQEIQAMIEQLQDGSRNAVQAMESGKGKADLSVNKAGEAGESLTSITSAVSRIHEMNMHIASAAEEQGAVAEEINKNVVSINNMADDITISSDQTAHAGSEVANLANDLQSIVERFKI